MKKLSMLLFLNVLCSYAMDKNTNSTNFELQSIAIGTDNRRIAPEFVEFAQEIQNEKISKNNHAVELSFLQKLVQIKARTLEKKCLLKHTHSELIHFFQSIDFSGRKMMDLEDFVQLEWQHGSLMSDKEQNELQKKYAMMIVVNRLYLSVNKLCSLPDELPAWLPALTSINLSYNQFTEIPAAVFGLTALTKLNFSHNAIEKINPEIGNLKKLKNFDVSHNKLTLLPKELLELEVDCNFEGNKINPSLLKNSSDKQPIQKKLSILQKLKLRK
ncbi:MAG: E3 ubiquitin-protein ligase sspH1 [Candidatus Dependentiae bacterium ADurb.Bin331]|nr:MAG: E3 ubiquitin-protein ligase sspH1 [Candidatus Dependentiae bacterium ADurb.Bin331]